MVRQSKEGTGMEQFGYVVTCGVVAWFVYAVVRNVGALFGIG